MNGITGNLQNRGERGTALAMTLLMVFIVTVLLFANISIQQNYLRLSRNLSEGVLAENAARSAIAVSLYELDRDSYWKNGFPWTPLSHVPDASYTVTFDTVQKEIPFSTSNAGSGTVKMGYGGRSVPPGFTHIIALGKYGKQVKQHEVMVKVGGFNPFGKGTIFSNDRGITGTYLRNSDSWDSGLGPYAGSQRNDSGNIGSNTTRNGDIRLGLSTKIYGNIILGPGGDPLRVVRGRANQYDQVVQLDQPMEYPLVAIPAITPVHPGLVIQRGERQVLPPGAYGDLTIRNGGVAVLRDGNYLFRTITADYNSRANPVTLPAIESAPVNEPVIIYTTGNINLRNGDLINRYKNADGVVVPSYLQIYGSVSTTMIEMRCGSSTTGGRFGSSMVLYAPMANLFLNGNEATSDFYGSLSVRQVSPPRRKPYYIYNVHYDKALQAFQCPEGLVPGSTHKAKVEASW